ncbi:MAG: TPM domain-containing protein [Prevotella sp.]|nr:TPM domain-containing protein [Prevotella sp.]
MENPFSQNLKTCGLGCLCFMALSVVLSIFMTWGEANYGEVSVTTVLLTTLIVLLAIGYLLRHTDQRYDTEKKDTQKKNEQLKAIADKFNKKTDELQKQYLTEVKGLLHSERESVRKNYESQYQLNKRDYEKEKSAFLKEWNSTHTQSKKLKKMWQWGICGGFIALLGACSFTIGATTEPEKEKGRMEALMEKRSWSAENIPMPHMTNGDLYVSNPDSILSQEVEDSINVILKRLDENLDVESAFVIVGHIEGDEPVNMVRGIYKKYKVGRNDRGLVVVVGYLDHSYFIAPGRSLEADMTDLECNHLAQDYLIPGMKAAMPDSAMLYLARGVYALLAEKERPQMSALKSSQEGQEDTSSKTFLGFFILLIGWGIFASRQASKLGWVRSGTSYLASNPFIEYTSSGGSGGGSSYSSSSRSSSSSSRSSSHSSGGYGGGSWGGGGSGGRW